MGWNASSRFTRRCCPSRPCRRLVFRRCARTPRRAALRAFLRPREVHRRQCCDCPRPARPGCGGSNGMPCHVATFLRSRDEQAGGSHSDSIFSASGAQCFESGGFSRSRGVFSPLRTRWSLRRSAARSSTTSATGLARLRSSSRLSPPSRRRRSEPAEACFAVSGWGGVSGLSWRRGEWSFGRQAFRGPWRPQSALLGACGGGMEFSRRSDAARQSAAAMGRVFEAPAAKTRRVGVFIIVNGLSSAAGSALPALTSGVCSCATTQPPHLGLAIPDHLSDFVDRGGQQLPRAVLHACWLLVLHDEVVVVSRGGGRRQQHRRRTPLLLYARRIN